MVANVTQEAKLARAVPEPGRGLEEPSEKHGGFGSHTALAVDERVYALERDFEPLGKCYLRHLARLQELLQEDLAWMSRGPVLGQHDAPPSGSPRSERHPHCRSRT